MRSARRIAATLAVAGGLLCTGQYAVAEESGSFGSISVLTASLSTLTHFGETIFAGSSEGASVIMESSGAPFEAGNVIGLKCLTLGSASAAGESLEASCAAGAGPDGELYLTSTRTGNVGHAELLGGTGIFEGITGTCSYEVAPASPTVDVLASECTWKR